jgi:hypothetical protein
MNPPPPKYRKPPRGPTPTEVVDAARWAELADSSLATTQAAAEKWRTGLAAFVTLVTGGLLLRGPGAAQDVPRSWLVPLTILAALGLALAVIGLWLALGAAAGSPARANLVEVTKRYGGVRQFEIVMASAASERLTWARRCVAASLLLLGSTVLVWWWTPAKPANPPAFVQVQQGPIAICGTLLSGDGGVLRIQVSGEQKPRTIDYGKVRNIHVVVSC